MQTRPAHVAVHRVGQGDVRQIAHGIGQAAEFQLHLEPVLHMLNRMRQLALIPLGSAEIGQRRGPEPGVVHPDGQMERFARQRFGLDGTLELLALNGYYSMMAMVLNTAGLPLPDNAAPPLQA